MVLMDLRARIFDHQDMILAFPVAAPVMSAAWRRGTGRVPGKWLAPLLLAVVSCEAQVGGQEPEAPDAHAAVIQGPDAARRLDGGVSAGQDATASDTRSSADAATPDSAPPDDVDADPAPDVVSPAFSSPFFDLSALHEVSIVVDPQHLAKLETDRVNRVPGTFTFDGKTIENAGVRKKGSYGSWALLKDKPAFTVAFDEFVAGQKLHGLDKIALNNARQDATLVAEHIGYELYRRAKLAAPFTAHAVVTFNGVVKGIYVIAEATDREFLRRNFGKANDQGNLYEGGFLGDVDFVTNPEKLELKREKEEMRTREDVVALARAINTTPVETWAATVGPLLDLPAFTTAYVIDGLTNHWDSYPYNANNYYLYRRPTDKRFVFIPHGMDSLFQIDVVFGARSLIDVHATAAPPNGGCRACGVDGLLARKLRAVPALDAAYRAEVQRVLRELWDLPALNARIDQVSKLIHETKRTDPAVLADVKKFDQNIPQARKFMADRRSQLLK